MPPIRPKESADVPKEQKVAHVLRAKQSRFHDCHWPNCGEQVPPAMWGWGCRLHWFMLPRRIRERIWRAYAPGQERTMLSPSREYVEAAREAQEWIEEHYG